MPLPHCQADGPDDWDEVECQLCASREDNDNMVLCDICDGGYHIYCLNPPLKEIPEGDWACADCIQQQPSTSKDV